MGTNSIAVHIYRRGWHQISYELLLCYGSNLNSESVSRWVVAIPFCKRLLDGAADGTAVRLVQKWCVWDGEQPVCCGWSVVFGYFHVMLWRLRAVVWRWEGGVFCLIGTKALKGFTTLILWTNSLWLCPRETSTWTWTLLSSWRFMPCQPLQKIFNHFAPLVFQYTTRITVPFSLYSSLLRFKPLAPVCSWGNATAVSPPKPPLTGTPDANTFHRDSQYDEQSLYQLHTWKCIIPQGTLGGTFRQWPRRFLYCFFL